MTGRLIVVSNRVSLPTGRQAGSAGGLAVGVLAALREQGGIWLGWSGELVAEEEARTTRTVEQGKITYVLMDLTEAEFDGFYGGMSNRTLWPLFHYRVDLTSFQHDWYRIYREVNGRFAEVLGPLLRPDDRVWIQDYHLIPMATELRRRDFRGPLGFFLHIPFPPAQIFATMPWHAELAGDLARYDSVGLQSLADRDHLLDYLRREQGAEPSGEATVAIGDRRVHAASCPIGIDVREIERLAASKEAQRSRDSLAASVAGRAVILGVDRLDYSKGIPERLRGYGRLLAAYPEHHRKVVLMQISAPSREDLPEYRDMRRQIERLVGNINGRYTEADWVPLRYLNRTHSRRALAGFYRVARAGLVTPLRDGLNLVAEEYVVAQDPQDPGVLVLSRFAGAAEILDGALIVNPYDVYGVGEALHQALVMPVGERRERHERLMKAIRANDVNNWRRCSLAALDAAASAGTGEQAA